MHDFYESYFEPGEMKNPYNYIEIAPSGEPGMAISLDPGVSVLILGSLENIKGSIG